jgi:hypothetical protein
MTIRESRMEDIYAGSRFQWFSSSIAADCLMIIYLLEVFSCTFSTHLDIRLGLQIKLSLRFSMLIYIYSFFHTKRMVEEQ